jgi:hypothetical protein
MSSGERFLKKKTNTQSKLIHRQTLVDITAAWLYAARVVDDSKNIINIKFIPVTETDFVNLEIETNGGATN